MCRRSVPGNHQNTAPDSLRSASLFLKIHIHYSKKTNKIVTILPIQAQSRFKQQLHQILIANESGIQIIPIRSCEYQIGELVKVISGILSGMVGKIIRNQGESKLILEIESLGGVSVSINNFQVELIQR